MNIKRHKVILTEFNSIIHKTFKTVTNSNTYLSILNYNYNTFIRFTIYTIYR